MSEQLLSSRSVEWYTPEWIVRQVRSLLDAIELDPCSSVSANQVVQAQRYYTASEDGLSRRWVARTVYMNPPYGREIGRWVAALAGAVEVGAVGRAVALLPARTDTAWMRRIRDYPRCYLHGRVRFRAPDGVVQYAAVFPSMIVGFNVDIEMFIRAWEGFGDCYVRAGLPCVRGE